MSSHTARNLRTSARTMVIPKKKPAQYKWQYWTTAISFIQKTTEGNPKSPSAIGSE